MATGIYLQEEMQKLRHAVLAMAVKTEENLGKALVALNTGNINLANEVRENDSVIDEMQLKIEDDAACIIALQAPVAKDLRELIAIFKITSNIERIGDHASHLAKAIKKLAKKEDFSFSILENLERMAETGMQMLRESINAFMEQNANSARDVAEMDSKIDEEHKILTESIIKLMKKNELSDKIAVQLLNTGNQLERLGDHITNICEAIVFMIEGKHCELN